VCREALDASSLQHKLNGFAALRTHTLRSCMTGGRSRAHSERVPGPVPLLTFSGKPCCAERSQGTLVYSRPMWMSADEQPIDWYGSYVSRVLKARGDPADSRRIDASSGIEGYDMRTGVFSALSYVLWQCSSIVASYYAACRWDSSLDGQFTWTRHPRLGPEYQRLEKHPLFHLYSI
jgi:hypothetical protein